MSSGASNGSAVGTMLVFHNGGPSSSPGSFASFFFSFCQPTYLSKFFYYIRMEQVLPI